MLRILEVVEDGTHLRGIGPLRHSGKFIPNMSILDLCGGSNSVKSPTTPISRR